jgi:hypothetical protein
MFLNEQLLFRETPHNFRIRLTPMPAAPDLLDCHDVFIGFGPHCLYPQHNQPQTTKLAKAPARQKTAP